MAKSKKTRNTLSQEPSSSYCSCKILFSFAVLLPFLLYFYPSFIWPSSPLPRGLNVVVFGASTGIGEEIAYEYARNGGNIVLVARQEVVLQRVAHQCQLLGAGSVHVVPADLSSREGCVRASEASSASLQGKIDIVILNHVLGWWGWWLSNDTATTSKNFDTAEKIFAVNSLSYIYLSTLLMPALSSSKGQLVVVSSGAGQMGLPKVAPYSSSKHALHGFFDSLRLELEHKNIPVSVSICVLGRIDTDQQRQTTGSDLQHVPSANVSLTAQAIVAAGNNRMRTLFYPPDQGLWVVSLLRPLIPSLFDKLVLRLAQ